MRRHYLPNIKNWYRNNMTLAFGICQFFIIRFLILCALNQVYITGITLRFILRESGDFPVHDNPVILLKNFCKGTDYTA